MKPFNLEEAKAGKPVCTRNGQDARIICFDAKINSNKTYIIALIPEKDTEVIYAYNNDGTVIQSKNNYDLMMKTKHHVGYVNLYKDDNHIKLGSSRIYDTYEEAKRVSRHSKEYIKTIKIEWEI